MPTERNLEIAADLRKLADWLETSQIEININESTFYFFAQSKEDFTKAAKHLGKCKKVDAGDYFDLRKDIGNLHVNLVCKREELCEKVQVGERVIPAEPERIVPEQRIEAQPEKVVPIYEWKCPPSILRGQHEEHVLDDEHTPDDGPVTPKYEPA